jgi:hypothetical protein
VLLVDEYPASPDGGHNGTLGREGENPGQGYSTGQPFLVRFFIKIHFSRGTMAVWNKT